MFRGLERAISRRNLTEERLLLKQSCERENGNNYIDIYIAVKTELDRDLNAEFAHMRSSMACQQEAYPIQSNMN